MPHTDEVLAPYKGTNNTAVLIWTAAKSREPASSTSAWCGWNFETPQGCLWLADGALVCRRAERPNHVWSYDFVFDRTADGRPLRLLAIVDEYTRECLSLDVARRLRSDDVRARLAQLFVERGPPTYLRSDNGPEFTAGAVREWLARVGVATLFIEPGSPWENGDVESFNGKLRDECLNRERFDTLLEAQVLIEAWRRNTTRSGPTVP